MMRQFLCTVFALLALPLGAGAQQDDARATSVSRVDQDQGSSERPSETPSLKLELSDAGSVEVAPSGGAVPSADEVAEMELRVRRAKIGIGASAFSLVLGGILAGVAVPNLTCEEPASGAGGDCPAPGWALPMFVTGLTLAGGGVLGLISTGALLGVRKRKLRRLRDAH